MCKPKKLIQLLWDSRFMNVSENVCTYYTLCIRENNYGKNKIEGILREMMQNCLNFIKEEITHKNNACKMVDIIDHNIIDHTPK